MIGAFVELFTVTICLNGFGCDVQQDRNWEFMMYIRCYIGSGRIAKQQTIKCFTEQHIVI